MKIMIRSLRQGFATFQKNNFLLVGSIQAGVLMGSGDLLAQRIIEKKNFQEINYTRTGRFVCLGFFLVGPACGSWYRLLDKKFGSKGTTTAIKKVTCDQFLFAPVLTAIITSTLFAIQGNTIENIRKEVAAKYSDILISNWKLWIPVQICNFYIIPLKHQLLVVQLVALGWNTYFSWKTQQKIVPK